MSTAKILRQHQKHKRPFHLLRYLEENVFDSHLRSELATESQNKIAIHLCSFAGSLAALLSLLWEFCLPTLCPFALRSTSWSQSVNLYGASQSQALLGLSCYNKQPRFYHQHSLLRYNTLHMFYKTWKWLHEGQADQKQREAIRLSVETLSGSNPEATLPQRGPKPRRSQS